MTLQNAHGLIKVS